MTSEALSELCGTFAVIVFSLNALNYIHIHSIPLKMTVLDEGCVISADSSQNIAFMF